MKSKKKLLLMGVGVMGALAMGVGATSTFAWYKASSSAKVASKTLNDGDITITSGNVSLGGFSVPVNLTVADNITSGGKVLGLAHFNGTAEHHANPNLTTGYLDDSLELHDLGYNSNGTPVLTGVKAGENDVTDLYATFTISVSIDYDAIRDDKGNDNPADDELYWSEEDSKWYFTPNGTDKYLESWIVSELNTAKATMLLGVKLHTATSRLHLFNTTAAYDSVNEKDEPYGDLSLVETVGSPIKDYVALTATGNFAAQNSTSPAATVNFYIYGEKGDGTADTTNLVFTNELDVKVDMPAS